MNNINGKDILEDSEIDKDKSPNISKEEKKENDLIDNDDINIEDKPKNKKKIIKNTKSRNLDVELSNETTNKSKETKFKTQDYNISIDNSIKTNYNQKMMEIINKIRNDPKSIIEDLELLLKKNNKEKKILIENDETHENIIFNDVEQDINETINFLKKIKHVTNTFSINDELAIDLKLHKISEIPLEKKITKIIIDKKREIVRKHPKVQFFVNFVKNEEHEDDEDHDEHDAHDEENENE